MIEGIRKKKPVARPRILFGVRWNGSGRTACAGEGRGRRRGEARRGIRGKSLPVRLGGEVTPRRTLHSCVANVVSWGSVRAPL